MQRIDNIEIGNRLEKLRDKKGLNELQATLELGISTATYSRLENGKGRITVEVLQRACRYYHTTAGYILFGEHRISESMVFQRLEEYSEGFLRRMLKILSCMLLEENDMELKNKPIYKIFMGGLIEQISLQKASAIPAVLKYEKDTRNISENAVIKELGITRFIWNRIMKENKIKDIQIPLRMQELYGYDLEFLINNKITGNSFFDELIAREDMETRRKIMQVFDSSMSVLKQRDLEDPDFEEEI